MDKGWASASHGVPVHDAAFAGTRSANQLLDYTS